MHLQVGDDHKSTGGSLCICRRYLPPPTTKIDAILLGIELLTTQLIPYCKGRGYPCQKLVPNHQVNLIIAQIIALSGGIQAKCHLNRRRATGN